MTQLFSIIFPLNIGHSEINLKVVQLLLKFHGMDEESPYLHLQKFKEVCATINFQIISTEQLKLKLFSFFLKDKTKAWRYTLWPTQMLDGMRCRKNF